MVYMQTPMAGSGYFLVGFIHTLIALSVAVGLLFLLVLAIKTLNHRQLKVWGWSLFLGGLIACLLLGAGFSSGSFGPMAMSKGSMKMQHAMMKGERGMDMSMNGMTMSLRGKTGDAFDEAFIEMMIPHHQGAIDMANEALTVAKHQEIKDLAEDIIASQQKEIDAMNSWAEAWGYAK